MATLRNKAKRLNRNQLNLQQFQLQQDFRDFIKTLDNKEEGRWYFTERGMSDRVFRHFMRWLVERRKR